MPTPPAQKIKFVFLRAVLFVVILNFGRFIIYQESGGYSPGLFQDWDESYYITIAKQFLNAEWRSLFRWQDGALAFYKLNQSRIPHQLLDLLIAKFLGATHIRPVFFLLVLDALIFLASYLILTCGFNKILKNSFQSEALAFVLLLAPWASSEILSLSAGEFFLSDSLSISSLAHSGFPSLPVQRAIYTQVSYLPFVYCLYCLFDYLARPGFRSLIFAGIATGLSLYCYFFAWLTLLTLIPLVVLIKLAIQPKEWKLLTGNTFLHLSSFVVLALLLSIPGLSAIFQGASLYAPGAEVSLESFQNLMNFRKYCFFSPQGLVLAVLIFAYRSKLSASRASNGPVIDNLCVICLALLVAEFLLMNTQALANAWVSPYHFPLFFLHPLLSAGLAGLLLQQVSSLRPFMLGSMLLYVLILGYWRSDSQRGISDYTELLTYIGDDLPEGSTIVSMPFTRPFANDYSDLGHYSLRSWIEALTNKRSFADLVRWPEHRLDVVRDEAMIAWIYSGHFKLLRGCQPAEGVAPPADLLTGASTFLEAQRIVSCELSKEINLRSLTCSGLAKIQVDYIIWDQELELVKPAIYTELTSPVWQGKSGRFSIIKFDQPAALAKYCPDVFQNNNSAT